MLRRFTGNSFDVTLASLVCLIVVSWNTVLSNEVMLPAIVFTLAIVLVVHNISTVFYLYIHKSANPSD